jgi:hypothetical protein
VEVGTVSSHVSNGNLLELKVQSLMVTLPSIPSTLTIKP